MPTDSLHADASIPCRVPPIIILGMHRSGTSMVAELLDQLGLFVGRRLQDDHESTFFLDLNDQLLARVGASWDHPAGWLDFLRSEPAMRMTALALRGDLLSRRGAKFFASGPRMKFPSFEQFDRPWGWKDPRTIFTLPLWLRLFPTAKLVYIARHGVDVAASLMVRERKLLQRREARFADRLARRSLRSNVDRAAYKGSPRCLTLEGAFSLWVEYVQQGDEALRGLPNAVHTIHYEDFLSNPTKHLRDLATFCGLNVDNERAIAQAVSQVNAGRANAFTSDPQLSAFCQQVKSNPWMVRFSYA